MFLPNTACYEIHSCYEIHVSSAAWVSRLNLSVKWITSTFIKVYGVPYFPDAGRFNNNNVNKTGPIRIVYKYSYVVETNL